MVRFPLPARRRILVLPVTSASLADVSEIGTYRLRSVTSACSTRRVETAMTVDDLPPVPLNGAHGLRRAVVAQRADAEVEPSAESKVPGAPQGKREGVDQRRQNTMKHPTRMPGGRSVFERVRHS